MSKYTTGEAAKLCGVSVRTIQYYDTKGIVTPSELTEGGRRLYSDSNIKMLKIVCFLRTLGLSLDSISELMNDQNSDEVILLLLKQQAQAMQKELDERRERLDTLNQLIDGSKGFASMSVQTIGDIAFTMKEQKKLRRVHLIMVLVGILMDILLIGSAFLWGFKKIWQPFAVCLPCVFLLGILLTRMYYKDTAYICPQCHTIFKPSLKEFLFSAHTPKTRKLTCMNCGHKGFCIETFQKSNSKNENNITK